MIRVDVDGKPVPQGSMSSIPFHRPCPKCQAAGRSAGRLVCLCRFNPNFHEKNYFRPGLPGLSGPRCSAGTNPWHHLGAGQQGLLLLQEVGAQRGVGTRSDHDGVAATGIDVDAGGAGRLAAGLGDQRESILRGQLTGGGTTGVVAQRAYEVRVGTGAAGRHGLVEALATGAGAVTAGNGRTRCRQRLAPPHVIDIEGTDDNDTAAHRESFLNQGFN